MVIKFNTQGCDLLDIVRELSAHGFKRWEEYVVIGKLEECHHLDFSNYFQRTNTDPTVEIFMRSAFLSARIR